MYFKFVVADATMLMKLQRQLPQYNQVESTFLLSSRHWVEDQKNTTPTQKTSQSWQWQEDGDTHQDSMSTYSEMPGGLEEINKIKWRKNNGRN